MIFSELSNLIFVFKISTLILINLNFNFFIEVDPNQIEPYKKMKYFFEKELKQNK